MYSAEINVLRITHVGCW